MDDYLRALRDSSDRLRGLVGPLTDDQLGAPGYPSEWSVAQVLSHIGSGAVIMQRRIEDGIRSEPTPDGFAPSVWDVWNAKSPRAMADDALAADRALNERLAALTDDERAARFSLGPIELDLAGLVGLRLNEHVLHTWDVEVVADPAATLPAGVTGMVVDNLAFVARWTARPTGSDRVVAVRTTDPERGFTVALTPERAVLEAADPPAAPDLTLPAEAFVRLVYGRLDPDHTPPVDAADATTLDELRRVFPGP
jgi:uncharacterized protein (TIGR03083 family)